jgi:hypothetical protein
MVGERQMERYYMKSTNIKNIYHPLEFGIGTHEWIFYDVFIQADSIIGIGPYESYIMNQHGIDYHKIYCKIDHIQMKGKMVKDPHNHTLIIRFSSYKLRNLLKQSNSLVCTLVAGKNEHKFCLSKPVNMGKGRLCLSTLQRNEYEYILTWIDYHQKIGVNHFYIYDNGSDDFERLQNLLQPYMENDVVTLIRWRFPYFSGENNNSGQTTQQNHTIYRFSNEWMIGLTDIDEYIFPIKIRDLNRHLKKLALWNRALLGLMSGVSIRSVWFGCNLNIEYDYKNFLLKLTKRKEKPEPRHQREKCIIFPEKVKIFSTHTVVRGRIVLFLPVTWLRLNHYFTLSKRNCTHEVYDQVTDVSIQKIME